MLFSIIIPHHNIPVLLHRLLSSIPQRDDTEIIIVDDNSDPEKVDFDHFPGSERSDVKIIFDKKGGGGGYVRNVGLKHATGKWVIFADADDYFNYCFDNVLDEYAHSDADIVYFKANSVDSETYVSSERTRHLDKYIKRYFEGGFGCELYLRYVFGEPWCKIIRRSVIEDNNIQFDETSIHNDMTFAYLAGHCAKTIKVDERAAYCVTSRSHSTSKLINETKKLERMSVFARNYKFLKDNKIDIKVDKHFRQLYESYFENRTTYREGLQIMAANGITDFEIKIALMKQFVYHVGMWLFVRRSIYVVLDKIGGSIASIVAFMRKFVR